MDVDPVLAQIDGLFDDWGFRPSEVPSWDAIEPLGSAEIAQRTTRAVALLERFAPGSRYLQAAREPFERGWGSEDASTFVHVAAALAAFRSDVEGGYLKTLAELIHADVFADLLGMATELQEKGYKDAAAVIAGSILEEHLRKLADSSGIAPTKSDGSPLKASVLNADLAKAEIYNKLEEKAVTAWLGLRNSAAHGKYDEFDETQVANLIRDIRDFMIRHPA
jgi:hypothetical protein